MKKMFFVATALAVTAMAGNARAFDNHDFQVWNTDVEEFKIDNSSKITLEEEFRWGDNANDFYYHHYDLGFVRDVNKHLNLGIGYRQVFEKKRGAFKQENEPYGMATLFWEALGFKFDDRSRLEYRHFDYQTDSWRYRNKFNIKFPWKFTRLQIQPFLGDEILMDLNGITLNQNRLYAGLGVNVTKNIRGEIYYLWQSTKSSSTGRWADTNVLGTKFKISF